MQKEHPHPFPMDFRPSLYWRHCNLLQIFRQPSKSSGSSV
jgi:hypothetical protein